MMTDILVDIPMDIMLDIRMDRYYNTRCQY